MKSKPSRSLKLPGNTSLDRSMMINLVASLVTVLLFVAIMAGAYFYLRPAAPPGTSPNQPPVPIPLKLTQQTELNNYGWIDKSAGSAHIPIGQAMQIIATQGVPALKAVPTQAATAKP